MAIWSVQTRFQSFSGFTEDDQVNTLHFEGDQTASVLDHCLDMVEEFYNHTADGAGICQLIASSALNGFATTRIYNLEDATPRVAVRSRDWELVGVTTGSDQAAEVTSCLSFAAAPIGGVPRARLRNRLYLPTLKASIIGAGGLITSAAMIKIAKSGEHLMALSDASLNVTWVVYSPARAAAGNGPADGYATVTHGWCDNAPDIQRRRGRDANARVEWPM